MNSEIIPGLGHNLSLHVDDRLLVMAFSPEFPGLGATMPVFATAFLVGFLEWACIEALRPYLPDGENTVGSQVYLSHRAARLMGVKLTAQVELVEVKSGTLRFRVDCFDEDGLVASGFHERMLVHVDRFATTLSSNTALAAA
ncbi:MAG TPA: hypothetical protein VH189_10045 [Rhizomicrobium sp.]|nr:hypothetical protein [Rhizomicrobium sp.]